MKSKSSLKPHQASLIWAAVATLVEFLVPFIQRALLPLEYLNTHLHEMSHAFVASITGAQVQAIYVHANGSGETPVIGGSIIPIASAGYLGASTIGALMIYFGRTEKGAKTTLYILSASLFISMIAWVRGDTVGVASGFTWAVLIGLCTFALKGRVLTFFVQFIGIQQCLNALKSVFVLVGISAQTDVNSDASILQRVTGLPSIFWAMSWSVVSLALVGWSLRNSWKTPARV